MEKNMEYKIIYPKNRTMKIPTINNGNEFELPERKVKHTHYVLEKIAEIENNRLRNYKSGYHTAYIVLKDVFPGVEYKDIDELSDDILTQLNDIIWGHVEGFQKGEPTPPVNNSKN